MVVEKLHGGRRQEVNKGTVGLGLGVSPCSSLSMFQVSKVVSNCNLGSGQVSLSIT